MLVLRSFDLVVIFLIFSRFLECLYLFGFIFLSEEGF